ncbi:MAG: hypothetical protein ABJE47_19545 [bacterium]
MTDRQITPYTLPLPRSAASVSDSPSGGGELSDNDLEHVVGGLARSREAAWPAAKAAESSFTIVATSVRQTAHRVSA